MNRAARIGRCAAIALPALVAAAVYANTLSNGLAGDDPWTHRIVAENPEIWRTARARAVTYAVHALDLWLWSESAMGLHATNLVLHAVATALVASIALRLAGSARVAGLCGLLFAVHPVHVEAVASFSNRKDVLALIFLMLALHCWLARGRLAVRWIGTPIFFLASLFSKEVAAIGGVILLPAAALLANRKGRARIAAASIPLVVLALVGAWSIAGDARRYFEAPMIHDLFGTTGGYGEILAKTLASVPGAVRLLVFPLQLSIDYPGVTGSARVAWGALLLAGWAIGSLALLRRAPVEGYGLLWALVMLLPASNLVPLTEFFLADRYLYVPSFGVCLAAAMAAVRLLRMLPENRRALRHAWGLLLAAVVAAGAVRTIDRNRDWANQWTLYASALAGGFETGRVHRGVGYGYLAHGVPGAALDHLRTAIAFDARLAHELAGPIVAAQTLLGRFSDTEQVPRDPAGLALIAEAFVEQRRRPFAIALLTQATGDDVRYGRDLAWVLAAHPLATPAEVAEAERVALAAAQVPGTARDRIWALCGAAVARTRSRDFAGAAVLAQQAVELARTSSDRPMVSLAQLVLASAEQSRPVILPVPVLFGLLWRVWFADFGPPQCHGPGAVAVLADEVFFDPGTGTFRAELLDCARLTQ